MRVVAEHRVAVDRPREHLVDGEGGADGGNHQNVHVLPQPADYRLEFMRDAAARRMCRPRCTSVRRAGSLGPRAGSTPAGRQGNRRIRPAAPPPMAPGTAAIPAARNGSSETSTTVAMPPSCSRKAKWARRIVVVAEELQFVDGRQSDPDIGALVARSACARPGVVVVTCGHHVENAVDVGDAAGHHADAVQRFARRDQADGADQAARRFEPDDTVERGRHPTRARRVGCHCERHLAQRNGQRRARTGTAADHFAAENTARHRVRGASSVQPGGELVEIGLADIERARVEQSPDRWRGCRSDVGVVGAGERSRHALDVDAVLHPERHPVERQSTRTGALFDLLRSRQQLIARHDGQPGAVVAPRCDGVGDSSGRFRR